MHKPEETRHDAHPLESGRAHEHGHSDGDEPGGGPRGHTHGTVDPTILTITRGIWAVKWSFVGLLITSVIQVVVVIFSGSVALLADTIHNFGDAATAVPLWIAFTLARRKPSKRFTYGYGRVEDLAGVAIVLTILASAIIAAYESIQRFRHPQPVRYLWAVLIASIVGFLGNEAVALLRIKVGKEIGSAALIADGYHARVDGLTSLAVLFSVIGIWLGYPLADPIIGILITVLILRIVWESAAAVFTRLLDGVDPEVVDEIKKAASQTPRVEDVTEVRVRWLGHRLHAELNLAVDPKLSVAEGHDIAVAAEQDLLAKLRFLSHATIHVDPVDESGKVHHHLDGQSDGEATAHSH